MHIARFGRFVFVAQWGAALLLPLFFFLGRGLVGAQVGWLAVQGFVSGIFAIGLLLVPPILTLFDRTVRRQKTTRFAYGISSFVLWGAAVIAALTVPDAADGPPLDPALTVWTGGGISQESAGAIFAVMAVLIGLAYIASLVTATLGIVRWRRPVGA